MKKLNILKEQKQKKNYYNKINGIDAVLWINLDSSKDRREKMEKRLSKIKIKNIRVRAVDGINNDVKKVFIDKNSLKNNINFQENLKNSELALTLSHFKAFNIIKKLQGKYFMICEDDISFRNIKYFKNIDLKKIIKDSPGFDILTLYKTKLSRLDELYTDLNEFNNKETKDHIWGSVAYIITKKFAEKMCEIISYDNKTKKFNINTDVELSPSDKFVFSFGRTFVYRYNFISTSAGESIVHLDDASQHITLHEKSIKNQLSYIIKDFK